ncbi:MAG TPA: threonine synthase [Caldilineae bacterium]|nr:threonine synthase [Caldilineae bacterium]
MHTYLSHLECSWCGASYNADRLWNVCPACDRPLLARYDLAAANMGFSTEMLRDRPPTLWRYAEMLPVRDPTYRLTLGEGYTPLLRLERLGAELGMTALYAKDESMNPTASFKARGLCMAVSRAAELGARALAIPSAGNAGSALAAYAARAGLPAHIFLPSDAPPIFVAEMRALGAEVTRVDGLITDCAQYVRAGAAEGRWFDVSTLREPYRVEGKKTMGYELAEQFGWVLPDVIIYPTGGGTGIVGMWKAFEEMEALGWIGPERPRMVSVQSAGCAPIVRAFEAGRETAEPWQNAMTIADGLRVPSAIGDFLILRALRDSSGTAIAVPDEEILDALREIGRTEGLLVAPEAAATVAALRRLRADGWIQRDERVVLFLTGSGLKYAHLLREA